MIYPAVYALKFIRRSSYDIQITLPVDLTASTVLAQLWNRERTEKYTDFTVAVLDASIGLIRLELNAKQTEALPTLGVYDVKVVTGDDEYYYLKGGFNVTEGYTDD